MTSVLVYILANKSPAVSTDAIVGLPVSENGPYHGARYVFCSRRIMKATCRFKAEYGNWKQVTRERETAEIDALEVNLFADRLTGLALVGQCLN